MTTMWKMPDGTGIPDVPDVSAQWYRRVVAAAAAMPEWLRVAADAAAEGLLLVFPAAMVLLWWRARRGAPGAMARALAAPAAAALGYLASETAKHLTRIDRPCRMMPDVVTIAPCPEFGDWSFPSNHAAIAGAAVAALWWAGGRWWAAVAVPVALGAAALRVVVGVHFPHDVLIGLLVGAAVAAVATPLVARAAQPVVTTWRDRAAAGVLVGRGPG